MSINFENIRRVDNFYARCDIANYIDISDIQTKKLCSTDYIRRNRIVYIADTTLKRKLCKSNNSKTDLTDKSRCIEMLHALKIIPGEITDDEFINIIKSRFKIDAVKDHEIKTQRGNVKVALSIPSIKLIIVTNHQENNPGNYVRHVSGWATFANTFYPTSEILESHMERLYLSILKQDPSRIEVETFDDEKTYVTLKSIQTVTNNFGLHHGKQFKKDKALIKCESINYVEVNAAILALDKIRKIKDRINAIIAKDALIRLCADNI